MECNPGDSLVFLNGKILACHPDAGALLRLALEHMHPEYMQVFLGDRINAAQLELFQTALKTNYPDVEIECIESGHALYDLIVSVA